MIEVKTKVGWFSLEQARVTTKLARTTNAVPSGSLFWTTPEGGEVEVTEVISSGEPSSWGDAVCRGEVVAYLRPGHPYRELRKPAGVVVGNRLWILGRIE